MESPEVRELRAHARMLAWRCAALALSAPLVPVSIGLLIVWLASGSPGPWAMALMMFGLLLGLPVALMLALDAARDRAKLEDDITGGRVLLFEGVLDDSSGDPDDWQMLRAGGVVSASPGQVQLLRVFQHSESVRGSDDRGRMCLLRVHIQRAAPPPGYAWRAQLGPDLRVVQAPEGVRFSQRRLTGEEMGEIRGYIRRLTRPDGGLWFGFVCSGLAAFGLIAGYLSGDLARAPRSEWISGGLMLIVGLVSIRNYATRLRLARRLRLDLSAGRAVTAQGLAAAIPAPDRTRRPGHPPSEKDEFLPVSAMLWTLSGRPADWRGTKQPL